MKRSLLIKAVALVPIVGTTWFVTTSIMAKPVVQSPTGDEPGVKITMSDVPQPLVLPPGAKRVPHRVVSYSKATSYDVQVSGNTVAVHATAEVMNLDRNVAHLWRLRVDQDDVSKVDRSYVDQMFVMPGSGKLSPTFAEQIELPAGTHRVSLTLYALPHGYDPRRLKDAQEEESINKFHLFKDIEVQ